MKRFVTCVATGMVLTFTVAEAAVINVPAGGDLQAAIHAAEPGDTIVLPAGARFVGQFRFPAKSGTVTLTSSGPLPDRRITEADAPLLATIASGVGAMAVDLYDAQNWVLDGIRFEANVGGYGEVIGLWRAAHITLRRLLLVVPSGQEQKRFILGNGTHITLTQSHCGGVWRSGQDSQCFAAWDGAGPYTITDNFLEAASENVLFGGADSTSPDTIPADILVENNLFTKRLEWKGKPRGVKNLFELKAARRVIVRRNVFERNWVDAQPGYAILFTPRNQDGRAPWTVIEDVLFEHNIVRDTPSHFNILGYDNLAASQQTTRITIRRNLLLGSGGGRMAVVGNEVGELVFDHNTYVNATPDSNSMITLYSEGSIATSDGTSRASEFAIASLTFTNHMMQFNLYGLHSSIGMGSAALAGMTKSYVWLHNVLAGGAGTYPGTTTFLAVAEYPSQFDPAYYLAASSVFNNMATDGTDLGWNDLAIASSVTLEPEPAPETEPEPEPEPDPEPQPEPTAISILTEALPEGVRNLAYSALLTADADVPVTWSLSAGALPTGLVLDPSSGVISGKPRQAGTFSFTVVVSDSITTATRSLSLYIAKK